MVANLLNFPSPQLLNDTAEADVCTAFRAAYTAIQDLQVEVSRVAPESSLIRMVKLIEPDGLSFTEEYYPLRDAAIDEGIDPTGKNFYFGLGLYIEALAAKAGIKEPSPPVFRAMHSLNLA